MAAESPENIRSYPLKSGRLPMLDHARRKAKEFQELLRNRNINLAILTDESSIAYLAGFWGYLSVEFGRPTCLLVPREGPPIVITPAMVRTISAPLVAYVVTTRLPCPVWSANSLTKLFLPPNSATSHQF